ncbi:unnamed protein product, partial [Onchocerca ochengi]
AEPSNYINQNEFKVIPEGGDHIVAPAGKELERCIGDSTPKYDFYNENIRSDLISFEYAKLLFTEIFIRFIFFNSDPERFA